MREMAAPSHTIHLMECQWYHIRLGTAYHHPTQQQHIHNTISLSPLPPPLSLSLPHSLYAHLIES